MGVLIGLSPLSPIAGANNAKAEGRATNLRDGAIPKNVSSLFLQVFFFASFYG